MSVQSTLDKAKKIKTESGSYIKASYKSNLYSKWLKNSKGGSASNRNEDDGDGVDDNQENKKQKNDIKNQKYFGSSLVGKLFNLVY